MRKELLLPALSVVTGVIVVICLVVFYMPTVIYSDVTVGYGFTFDNTNSYERFLKTLPYMAKYSNFEILSTAVREEESLIYLHVVIKAPYNVNVSMFEPLLMMSNRLKFVVIFTVLALSLIFCVMLPLVWLLDSLKVGKLPLA
jgi:hypothetical protein